MGFSFSDGGEGSRGAGGLELEAGGRVRQKGGGLKGGWRHTMLCRF